MQNERLEREIIAMRVARELQDGDVVNLGIGIPTLCSQFVPEGRSILYHSESGVLNYGCDTCGCRGWIFDSRFSRYDG